MELLYFRSEIFLLLFFVFLLLYWNILRQKDKFKKENFELRLMLTSISNKQQTDNKKITNEFHDGLKNDIIAAKNFISLCEAARTENNRLSFLTDAKNALDDAFINADRLSSQLMPSIIKVGKIIKALQNYFIDLHEKTGRSFSVNLKTPEFVLSSRMAYELYNVIKELCENIIDHCDASQIDLFIFKEPNCIIFELIDNGSQYDFIKCYDVFEGNGLKVVKARILILDGELIQKKVSQGNHIIIKIKE